MEVWKNVEGFVGYKVSNFGRVIGPYKRVLKHKLILKDTLFYYGVSPRKNGKNYHKTIHRLLAIAFIPNPENKPTVDHIDRNSLNNALSNLRWATRTEQNLNKHNKPGILQEKNIYKHGNGFRVRIPRNCKIVYNKTFPTLQEAIIARDLFLLQLPCVAQATLVESDPPTTNELTEVVDT
jgi:flagellar biosynthesis/type III secretory pathway chaperone